MHDDDERFIESCGGKHGPRFGESVAAYHASFAVILVCVLSVLRFRKGSPRCVCVLFISL